MHVRATAGSRQWKNYSRKDHAWNVRAFKRWIKNERAIMQASNLFNDLRDDSKTSRRKRTREMSHVSTASSTESPKHKRYVVPDNSSSEEYESADDDEDRADQSPGEETEEGDE